MALKPSDISRPPVREMLWCGLRWRCPHCRQGRLFGGWFRVLPRCPSCRLAYFRESGYFVGAMIVNYAVTVVVLFAAYLFSLLLPDIPGLGSDWKLGLWLLAALMISLALMRHCYSFWLAFDYWFEPWQPE